MVAELSISGGALAGLVKRGVVAAHDNIARLHHDAGAYDRAGPDMHFGPWQWGPVVLTGLISLLTIGLIRYMIGDVVVTLAMVEAPVITEIIEPKAPSHHDVDGKVSEKERMEIQDKEDLIDVEITTIRHKPFTAKISTTLNLVHRDGGFSSRWRGMAWSWIYHGLHSTGMHFLGAVFGFSWISNAILFVLMSLLLSRFRAFWTHLIIVKKTSAGKAHSISAIGNSSRLFLPTLVYAAAQQATLIVPMVLGSFLFSPNSLTARHGYACAGVYVYYALSALSVAISAAMIAFCVLLPAAITLTRIEATLLPSDIETIVPFDKESIIGELDLQTRSGRKVLFVQTWKSVDFAACFRVVKIYLEMAIVQFTFALIGFQLMVVELFLMDYKKLALLYKSARAELQLAAARVQG